MLELEKSERAAPQVQRLLRLAHTLKGAARVVKQAEIADGAHAIEDELSTFREAAGVVPRKHIDAVLRHVDAIGVQVGVLTAADPAQTAAASVPVIDDALRTVRADIAEMDALAEGVSEVHTLLNGLRPAIGALERGRHLADLLQQQL
ncbi:MAG TPA: Hpt domain-containing protein, partial [Caulobacteraceae bacterium]|nr:Hpt domain-containing protein [Caulobacteraceae bacterium]